MAAWFEVTPAFLVALAVLVVGGYPAAHVVGLRGVLAWGTAPLFAAFGVAVSATALGELGVRWGVVPYLVGVAVSVALAGVARAAAGRWRSPCGFVSTEKRWVGWLVVAAAVVVALVELRRQALAIGAPGNISQTFDNIFHLNSVAAILDNGNASTLRFDLMSAPGSLTFYPGLWHQVVSLVVELTGVTVPVAANVVTLGIATVVWPLALLAFARTVFGPRPLLLGAVAVLAFSLVQFPLLLQSFGVLYPNLYSYAMLPGLLGLAVCAARYARGRRRLAPLLAAGAGAVSLTVAQPNGLIGATVIAVPLVIWHVTRRSGRAWRSGRRPAALVPWVLLVGVAATVYVALGTIPMLASFRDGSDHWGPVGGVRAAVAELVTLAAGRSPALGQFRLAAPLAIGQPQLVMAVLVLLGGVAALLVARWRWLVGSYAILGLLFVIAQAVRLPGLRGLATGYWYSDAVRLAALLPVVAIPLAALGTGMLATLVGRVLRPLRQGRHGATAAGELRRVPVAATVAVVVVAGLAAAVVLPRTATVRASYDALGIFYSFDPVASDSPELVSQEELEVFDVIADTVPEGVAVAGDPWDGSSMVRAFADRVAIFPNPRRVSGDDEVLIQQRLNQAAVDPAVCDAVERLDLGYVTRFGRHLWGGWPGEFGGLDGLEDAGVGELVAEVGEARLYRITACG